MALFKTITQGGQVHLHQLRMLRQVVMAALALSVCIGIGYFAWSFWQIPSAVRQKTWDIYWAKLLILTTPSDKHKTMRQKVSGADGKTYERLTLHILQDKTNKEAVRITEAKLNENIWKSTYYVLWSFLGIFFVWFVYGLSQKTNKHKRGNSLVHWKTLRRQLYLSRKASDLKLGRMPMIKNSETSHILLIGTTGTGKSNAFHILLPQIKSRGNRAIVVDLTGDYVSRYYQEGRDIILNPLDERSKKWSPWADCKMDFHYDVLAESIIQPSESYRDPFWENASRAILKTAMRKMAVEGKRDVTQLYEFLLYANESEFEHYFKDTEALTFASRSNEKTTQSIRSTLTTHLEGLRYLESSHNYFSIRDWVSQIRRGGWLFITARPDQRSTLIPLISAWLDIAINALMALPPDPQRRMWFIIDELASLQKLPCLLGGLAEGRKYGACFLVGFQNKQQLEALYGREDGAAMLDLFNTKAFFRCTEPNTQQWIAKVLGDKEAAESNETISFGAHSMRDGVSLGHHSHQRPIVLPSELSLLENLHCYLKLPGDYPATLLKTPYRTPKTSTKESFILKPEKRRRYA